MASTVDRDIIVTLVQSAEALEWAKGRVGWQNDSLANVCVWAGITCDPIDSAVTEINVSMAGLNGTIPSELGQLTSLRKLDLFRNHFTGTVPSEVLALPELVSVRLGMNALGGGFPFFLSSNLEVLGAEGNLFTGSLPRNIGDAYPGMIELDLSNNSFTGVLSEDVLAMTSLVKLNLSFNKLYGIIPRRLGELTNLEGLFLNDNSLYGPIPLALAKDGLKLIQVFLQHNALSGTIPGAISEILTLQDFFVDGNKLTGEVPMEICAMNLNTVYFQTIPGSDTRDGCDSIACGINFKSEEGMFPCVKCPNGKFTQYLGWNGVCEKTNERHVIDNFYREAKGDEWVNAERWGNQNVPHCLYEGIDCNDEGHIVNITLSQMNLQGTIPAAIGRLAHLRNLHLDGNALTGVVPSDLRFPPLETLIISDNKLLGPLPPLLCAKEGLNGNGFKGTSSCSVIACPAGTWHWNGRTRKSGDKCLPCPSQQFVGQVHCGNAFAVTSMEAVSDIISKPIGGGMLALCLLVVLVVSVHRLRMRIRTSTSADESEKHVDSKNYRENGLFNANSFDDDNDEEELGVLSSNSENVRRNAPSNDASAASPSISRSTSSPDHPDAQDLWLDVPKIA